MKIQLPAFVINNPTKVQVTSQQVTADLVDIDNHLNVDAKSFFSSVEASEEGTGTLIEIQASQFIVEQSTADGRLGSTKKRTSISQRKGGWPTTKYLPNEDVRSILDGVHHLARLRKPLTHFVTLRPPWGIEGDQPQKLWCRRQIQNIQRKLSRKSVKFIACYIYEKNDNSPLHVHLLVHVPERVTKLFSVAHNPPDIDIRPARNYHKGYITKNRKWQGPDREKWLRDRIGLRWQKGKAFRGKRWDWSSEAKQLLTKADKE